MSGTGTNEKCSKAEPSLLERSSSVLATESLRDQPYYLTSFKRIFHTLTSTYSITRWIGWRFTTTDQNHNENRRKDHPSSKENKTYFWENGGSTFHNYLTEHLSGLEEPLLTVCDDVPSWFDHDKFQRGRIFAMKHILGLVYAEQLCVVALLSIPMLRKPLVFSGKSDSDEKSFRRYLSTVERVITWYKEDIWMKESKAYRNLQTVRQMHRRIEQDMSSCAPNEREVRSRLISEETATPLLMALHGDLEPYLPSPLERALLSKFDLSKSPCLSQSAMAITQFGFVSLMILHPGKFGGALATEEELDDFVYVWYVLGHQLGISDRFNLCAGGLTEARQRCHYILHHIVLPFMAMADNSWELMARYVVSGVHRMVRQSTFEATLSYGLWSVGVPAPRLNSLISWRHRPRIWLFKFVLCVLHIVPGMAGWFGSLLQLRLSRLRRRLDRVDALRPVFTVES